MILLLPGSQFSSLKVSRLGQRKQILLEHKCVHIVQVVAWQGFCQKIAVALIERQRCLIVHRSFKKNSADSGILQSLFGGSQQLGTNSEAPSRGQNIDGDDMAYAAPAGFRNDKAKNCWG